MINEWYEIRPKGLLEPKIKGGIIIYCYSISI